MKQRTQLEVEGRTLEVSNLNKVLYPKAGFTKGQVIDYYIKISPYLLPHLHNRPITLKRYPDGVEGFFFYEKNCPAHRPKWMKTTNVVKTDGSIDYCVINELPALVWTANLADLELHTFLHRAPKIDRPTALAFDLDPGEPANIIDCCQVALRVKDLFGKLKLECFPKTSGSKGMQVYVPLNTPATYEQTKEFARRVAQTLEQETPESCCFAHGQESSEGQNIRRLEPERRTQNDDQRVFIAGEGFSHRFDSADLERSRDCGPHQTIRTHHLSGRRCHLARQKAWRSVCAGFGIETKAPPLSRHQVVQAKRLSESATHPTEQTQRMAKARRIRSLWRGHQSGEIHSSSENTAMQRRVCSSFGKPRHRGRDTLRPLGKNYAANISPVGAPLIAPATPTSSWS